MKSHELARQLLSKPDMLICVPAVKEYDDSENCVKEPVITEVDGFDSITEQECKVLLIDQS